MIIKCSQYDLLQLPAKKGQIYYVTDIRCLYKDFGAHKSTRSRMPALVLNTEYERENRIRPEKGRNYYIVESNNLWVYDNRWLLKDGDIATYNAYGYSSNSGISPVISTDENISSLVTGDRIIDNNGLLQDGSVVVRDTNRIIKAITKVDNQQNEIALTSYLDNGMTLYPNGLGATASERQIGSLHLGVEGIEKGTNVIPTMEYKGKAEYRGDLYVVGNIYNVVPANPYSFEISAVPKNASEMTHTFKATKTLRTENGVPYVQHNDFKIRVISETEALVTITTYTNDTELVTNDQHEILYDGVFVWGNETTYEATRVVEDTQRVTYSLLGVDHDISITITGTPINAFVAITTSEFSDVPSEIYAQTELLNIYCLTDKLLDNSNLNE